MSLIIYWYEELLKIRNESSAINFEIQNNELTLGEELGEGFFGKVHLGIN